MNKFYTAAVLEKKNVEKLLVRITESGSYGLFDLRVFNMPAKFEGEPQPTRSGVCLIRTKRPERIRVLQAAERDGVQ